MRGIEQASEHSIAKRSGSKLRAHVAPVINRAIDTATLCIIEAMQARFVFNSITFINIVGH